ncbi:magnesium transporter [Candidatus Peregrinibacteria bacterium]|nr:magnesium transporter [Candidatus Peregrinibacteria bacterium]
MAFFSEIFFSTLIGKPVYTLDEKYYGNFRDFIVKKQNGNFLITKVRIRTLGGERIIIPWNLIHSIEADPVSLKLKKRKEEIFSIEYDEDELRLKRDFLDQQIIDTENHRVVRVNDLKIVAVKDELFMVAADIGSRGLLRRIGLEGWALSVAQFFKGSIENVFIPSKYIDPYPARIRHDITLTVAQEQLKNMHPADLADVMEDLDGFERISILQSLPTEIMAKTIAEMKPSVRAKILGKIKDETLTKMLERLAPDAATGIVSNLPRRRMRHLLNIMKTTEAEEIRELLLFKKDTAGRIMNPEVISFKENFTVAEVIGELRKRGDHAKNIFYIYVVDEEGILKGVVSLRELIFIEPYTKLSAFAKKKPVAAKISENIDSVVEKITKYDLVAIPIVGKKRKLEGVITVDDILPLLKAS